MKSPLLEFHYDDFRANCLNNSTRVLMSHSTIKINKLSSTSDEFIKRCFDFSQAMEEDELQGLIPFFVSTTLGTTGSCSFDALEEIGQALLKFPNVWLHVDAAYAGNAFICPELKPLLKVKKINLRNRQLTSFFIRASSTQTPSIRIPTNGCWSTSIAPLCGCAIESA